MGSRVSLLIELQAFDANLSSNEAMKGEEMKEKVKWHAIVQSRIASLSISIR
jgi:hypothetical protein